MIDPVAKIDKLLQQMALRRADLRVQVMEQPDIADGLREALSQLEQAESNLHALKPRATKLKKRQSARARKPTKAPRPPAQLPAGWPLSAEAIQAAAQALVQRARPPLAARPAVADVSQGHDVQAMDSAAWKSAEHEREIAEEDRHPPPRPAKTPPPKPQRRVSDSSITGWEIVDDPE